jgi:uncharacterized membrane protein
VLLALAVFAASAVEMVEALTIVLAAGTTRGWRSAFEGTAVAVVVLGVLVGVVGVPLVKYVPITVLRVVIGGLLLVLGLGWLRKAILRASGHKALHDEDAIYASTVAELSAPGARDGAWPAPNEGDLDDAGTPAGEDLVDDRLAASRPARVAPSPARVGRLARLRQQPHDSLGFVVAFKGVFLEGMEVVLIVISLGASAHRLGLAAAAAGAAVVIVGVIGAIVARQLSQVPENTLKMGVGIMLTSFGVFWVGEGAGVRWPGSDLSILWLIALFTAAAALGIAGMRRLAPSSPSGTTHAGSTPTPATQH